MNKHRIAILLLLLISTIPFLSAADPAWVLLEKGKSAFEQREMTEALDTLLDAVELNQDYPEAEYWLGKVYEAQGQAVLAEEQFRRAIELSIYLQSCISLL